MLIDSCILKSDRQLACGEGLFQEGKITQPISQFVPVVPGGENDMGTGFGKSHGDIERRGHPKVYVQKGHIYAHVPNQCLGLAQVAGKPDFSKTH